MRARTTMSAELDSKWLAAAAAFVLGLGAATAESAGPRQVADTLTATTANMTPEGIALRVQILEWQDAGARAEVVAALAAGEDATTPLGKLPTVGYIWPNGSPVGYSVKYAERETTAGGGERITLVTDKRLGSYDFKGWSVASPAKGDDAPYSVVELYLDGGGAGSGNLSLAAEVSLDAANGTVALKESGGAPRLLTNVKRESPRP